MIFSKSRVIFGFRILAATAVLSGLYGLFLARTLAALPSAQPNAISRLREAAGARSQPAAIRLAGFDEGEQ